jgi:hypothetical protein
MIGAFTHPLAGTNGTADMKHCWSDLPENRIFNMCHRTEQTTQELGAHHESGIAMGYL